MIRFLELLVALAIVVTLLVLVGLFLPNERTVQHQLETNHPVRQVYDSLNSFRRFHEWHPLRQRDPRIVYTLEGPERGIGARLNYSSRDKRIGDGSWEIVESLQDERIVYRLDNKAYGDNKLITVDLREKGKTVEVKFHYGVEYGWSLPGRYAGLYVNRTAGDDLRNGLGNLIGLIATMPNFDYKSLNVALAEVAPKHVLYASVNSDRNITAVENAMLKALAEVRSAIAANGLREAGPPRLITTNFGSEKYEFDVAVPVVRPEWDAIDDGADETTATDPSADAASVAAMAVDQLPALEGLQLPENVLQGVGYSGRALRADFQGHPAALPLVRDMLRSYAAAYGETIHDRAYEEYLTEIDQTSAEDAFFNVYWPIR